MRALMAGALVMALAATAKAKAPTVEGLKWLEGSWTSTQTDGGLGEQTWLAPRAGTMMGVFRLIRKDKVEFAEVLTVTQREYGLVLTIRRFDKGLTPLPGEAEFTSTSQTATGTVFESKDAKLGRITWRTSKTGMEVQVIPAGTTKPVTFTYTRVR